MTCRQILTAALLLCLAPVAALAQAPTTPAPKTSQLTPPATKVSHWGISVSFTPTWKIPSTITNKFTDTGTVLSISGSQFSIGIVHGRSTSGDWGVSFVRQPVKNGSSYHDAKEDCNPPNGWANGNLPDGCFDKSTVATTQGATFTGVEVHKYIPFGLIQNRVQIGINVAGGFGKVSGNLNEIEQKVNFVSFNPHTMKATGMATTTVTTKALTDELFTKVPLAHIGVVVAFLVHPAVKVRWEGGFVMPGVSFFRVMGTYLIGAH